VSGIPVERWGKDHWSTFAYIETRIVDFRGLPDRDHMRCNTALHPGLGGCGGDAAKYPTRLRGCAVLKAHDDWSCLEDAEEAGLLENNGSGINPMYALTEMGTAVAGWLREHKAKGGSFATFTVVPSKLEVSGTATGRWSCSKSNMSNDPRAS
jgi:hypothetical protein